MATPLGEKLVAVRQERGWSLREVERRSGIRNAHLSQIETGVIERPDPNILWTLAGVYELDFADLMRLAGHVSGDAPAETGDTRSAAWKVLAELTPEEQQEVVNFLAELRRRKDDGADRA